MGDQIPIHCIFQEILPTCNPSKRFADKVLSDTRIKKIHIYSTERGDNFKNHANFNVENNKPLHYHKDCYSDYTSQTKINRMKRKINQEKDKNLGDTPPVKKTRRYAYAHFYIL